MSESIQPTIFYSLCGHYGKKNCKECCDYDHCEAKLIDESKELDFNFWNDDAEYSPLSSNYDDLNEQYAYVFDRKRWLSQNIHGLSAGGYLHQIPSNIHNEIYWSLVGAKNPSDLQNTISNTCVGIFFNILKKWKVPPETSAQLCPLLNLKNFEDQIPNFSQNDNVVLCGKNDLLTLLKPKHEYFKNLQGEI